MVSTTTRLESPANLSPEDFIIAAANGQVETVTKALNTLANPNLRLTSKETYHQIFTDALERNLGENCTALEVAALKGQVPVVRVLLEDERVRAAIREKQQNVPTVLHLLTSKSGKEHIEIYGMLLQAGADPIPLDERKNSPIACAVQYQNPDLLSYQLEQEAATKRSWLLALDTFLIPDLAKIVVNYTLPTFANFTENDSGLSPLSMVVSKIMIEADDPGSPSRLMFKLLLAHGGDPEQRIVGDKTILEDAEELGAPKDVIESLKRQVTLLKPPKADDVKDADSDSDIEIEDIDIDTEVLDRHDGG